MFEINPTSLPFNGINTGVSWDGTTITLDGHAGGDVGVFPIPFKCEVVQAQMDITTSFAGGTSPEAEVRFDRRFAAGSDTGRTDGDVGKIILGIAGVNAAGEVAFDKAGIGVSLEPGMEVVAQVIRGPSGPGHAGKARPGLLVRYLPETNANLSALQETT